MLLVLGLSNRHLDCLGTTITSLAKLKFHFLPFSKGSIVHPLKLAAVEEEVCTLRRSDEAKPSVRNQPSNWAFDRGRLGLTSIPYP